MILSGRTKELILAICERHEQGMYVDGTFLVEHQVGSAETAIFDTVSTLLRGICRLPDSKVMKVIMLGAGTPDQVAYDAFNAIRLAELTEDIRSIPDGRLSRVETNELLAPWIINK